MEDENGEQRCVGRDISLRIPFLTALTLRALAISHRVFTHPKRNE